ncbi:hypothetical protein GCM10022251_79690 [Phytohabitans flavus]|uniref:hypothetical protein n=1 Tax=Phytohabitans flavus TaxID=1076124 RepID=UPI001567B524|nr:hypothetical protein [Phytohabitans flavus]
MAFDAHVLKVLIASPGDTRDERDAVERALHAWNADRAEREQVVLLPRRWETNAVPRLGSRGQSVINEQLVDTSDIVVALFDSRLGMATEAAVSGTAEEIQRSHDSGRPVHVYFSEEPIPREADLEQVKALEDFKRTLMPLGLLGTYVSPDDLGYKVRQAIESDLGHLNLGAVVRGSAAADHAVLRASYTYEREPYVDSKGRTKYRTRAERLIVRNIGVRTAEQVHVEIRALQPEDSAPILHGKERPDIIPSGEFGWPLLVMAGTSRAIEVVMSWTEDDQEHLEKQHVAF